jgi:hypothetical protein
LAGYEGDGQASSEARVGLVAHELTHVLQRDLADPHFWPTGFPRPNPQTRWLFDSTNYMEALSYIVGSIVEHDLETFRLGQGGLSDGETETIQARLQQLEGFLATLTSADAHLATGFVVQMYPTNPFYLQNYRAELGIPDGRIPAGGWDSWLLRLGFSGASVDHIRSVAAQGVPFQVDLPMLAELARAGQAGSFVGGLRLPALSSGSLAVYLGARLVLDRFIAVLPPWAQSLAPLLDWSGWLAIGLLLGSSTSAGVGPNGVEGKPTPGVSRGKSLAIVGAGGVLGFAAALLLRPRGSLTFGPVSLNLNFGSLTGQTLALVAFGLGLIHETIGKSAFSLIGTFRGGVRAARSFFTKWWRVVRGVVQALRGDRGASR